jgi:hypothetical protein
LLDVKREGYIPLIPPTNFLPYHKGYERKFCSPSRGERGASINTTHSNYQGQNCAHTELISFISKDGFPALAFSEPENDKKLHYPLPNPNG